MRVGVDIGGTKTEGVAIDDDGTIRGHVRLQTGFGAAAVISSALTAVDRLADDAGISRSEFSTVGIGIPGTVDSAAGVVTHAINLGVERLDLGVELSDALGARARIENDVNAAAVGTFQLLGLPEGSSLGYLGLGTGLAAGLVLGGELWRGSRGTAGEIGHILVDPNGPLDLDGQRGGLEVLASGSGIARQWGTGEEHPVIGMLEAAAAGDARALGIRRGLFEGVANAVRILVLTVDVDVVVIGGGISGLGQSLSAGVGEVFHSWAARSPFIDSLDLPGRIRILPPGSPVAAIGAAHLGGK